MILTDQKHGNPITMLQRDAEESGSWGSSLSLLAQGERSHAASWAEAMRRMAQRRGSASGDNEDFPQIAEMGERDEQRGVLSFPCDSRRA